MWKLGRIFALFRKELLLAWAVLRDARAPWSAKLVTVLAVLYVVSPVDLVSDLIPVLGWLDDGLIAYLLLQLAFKFLPPDLMAALKNKVNTRVRPVSH
ncbi:YkvA family protein [Ottowia sp.]|uniref:YkvA family protein n=1 Tax=Ottowia sp. TaxID=1898956 RepID=UPI003A84BB50